MKPIIMPSFLHEVFGEKQSPVAIMAILLFGGSLTAVLYVRFPEMTASVPLWRTVLALLLIFDIFSGCIANFTASTSNFYAQRSRLRLLFIAIHFHIVLVALLLQSHLGYAVAIWGYTIVGAFIVNALAGRHSQRFVAGLLLAIGMGCMPLLADIPPYMLIVGLLFMLKVLFSFAVDHYGR